MAHDRNPGFQAGNHWNTCQRCGFDIRANESMIDPYKNIVVCKACWEPLHPQLYIKAIKEEIQPEGITTGKVD